MTRSVWRQAGCLLCALICFLVFFGLSGQLTVKPRPHVGEELSVTFPKAVQVLFALGDRYLAANLLGFRVLVADTQRMDGGNFAVQGRLQRDLAWLNPAHEDNYYIAAALLPWNGQLDAAQYVLREAMNGRQNDIMPWFYYAFDIYYFEKNPASAAEWLRQGAQRALAEQDRLVMEQLAARWFERGHSPAVAAGIVDAMADQTRSSGFRGYLKKRALRLRQLESLREATDVYRERHAYPPKRLEDLVVAGLLKELPVDPLGAGFALSPEGVPVLKGGH